MMEWLQQILKILQKGDGKTAMAYVLVVGCAYLLLICVVVLSVWIARLVKKKRKSRYPKREVQFTLPDRENSYIRSRLLTTLNTEREVNEHVQVELPLSFLHAQKLLTRVASAPLSPAERLELCNLTSDLEGYFSKTRFSAVDVRAINAAFLRLLKLSAKYAL